MCYENYGNCYQPPILGPAFRPAPRFGYHQPPVPVFGRPLFPSPYAAGNMNGYYNGFNEGTNLTAFFGFTAGTLIGDWLRNRGQQPCQQQAQACQEQPGTGYNQAPAGQSQVYPPASVRTVEPPRIQAPAVPGQGAPAQGANGEGDKNIYQQLMAKIAEQTARIDELLRRLGQQGCSDKQTDKTASADKSAPAAPAAPAPAKHKVKAKAKPVDKPPCTDSPKPEASITTTADEKNSCDPSDPFSIKGKNQCGNDPSEAITSNLCHRTNDKDKNYSDPNDAPYLPASFTPADASAGGTTKTAKQERLEYLRRMRDNMTPDERAEALKAELDAKNGNPPVQEEGEIFKDSTTVGDVILYPIKRALTPLSRSLGIGARAAAASSFGEAGESIATDLAAENQ